MPPNFLSKSLPKIQNVNDTTLGIVISTMLDSHPGLNQDVRATRSGYRDWLDSSSGLLLKDEAQVSGKLTAVYKWLSASLSLDYDEVAGVPTRQVVDTFLSVMVLVRGCQQEEAYRYLLKMQTHIFNESYLEQAHITDLRLFEMNEDEDEDEDEDEEDQAEHCTSASPPRKRFKPSTSPPTTGRSHFLDLCNKWHTVLQAILQLPVRPLTTKWDLDSGEKINSGVEVGDSSDTFEQLQTNVVACIREMRAMKKGQFSQPSFHQAVKLSGLAEDILKISHPSFYAQHHHPHNGGTRALSTGKELIMALREKPALIPMAANPSSVFFMCSERNFETAWHHWLKWNLRTAGYNVLEKTPKELYRITMEYLAKIKAASNASPWGKPRPGDDILLEIVRRSDEMRKRHKKLNQDIRQVAERVKQKGLQRPVCPTCGQLSPENQCWTTFKVERNVDEEFLEGMRGKGVTFVPPEGRMKPILRKTKKNKTVTELVSADALKIPLRRIAAREDILKRCGKHVIVVEEADRPGVPIDFVCYNAFPEDILKTLIENHQTATGVCPLKRGAQFDFWSSGVMYPFGARLPSGGRPGDTYVHYAGITAQTIEGIDVLFRQATTLMILMDIAKLYHPEAVLKLQEAGEACESAGLSGVNLYTCDDYTAPLHTDKDAVRGLCSQIINNVRDKEYEEYGFVNLRWGYYISTCANMLW
ncbi:hypothetical protein V5O48_008156 [Marasmius crinis-equi]|uniref:Uncharacterized protein n=1 Tax=Marasmius crinis-equi TaxID=585013 RepID=A0ABR3FEV4_9AGAR